MSEERRRKQAERLDATKPPLSLLLISKAKKHWMLLLSFLGVSTIFDLLKERLRTMVVDQILNKFGSVGVWIISYKFGALTLGLVVAFVYLVTAALLESHATKTSTILDQDGNPYQTRDSRISIAVFTLVGFFLCALMLYGAYDYYRVRPFLNEFPLGYVIFDMDTVTGAVMPNEVVRKGLENYEYDFRPTRIIENTSTRLTLQLPDIFKDQKLLISGSTIGGDRRTMERYEAGSIIADGDNLFQVAGRALQYQGSRVTWIVGFRRFPFKRPSPQ